MPFRVHARRRTAELPAQHRSTRQAAAPPRGCRFRRGQAAARVHRLICSIARGYSDLDWSALGLLAAKEAGLGRGHTSSDPAESCRASGHWMFTYE
jgi:hypothetical protein